MTDLWQRLKQRKLVQWAIAYVAFAFAVIQVLDVIAQRFGWPDQLEKILILALAVGFLVMLVLAWYHGERGAQRVSSTEIVILALLLAIGGGLLWRFERAAPAQNRSPDAAQRNPGRTIPDSVAAATSSGLPIEPVPTSTQAIPIPAKSIAVLPFENLSEDKGNAYFADGMQDLILTKLADIGDIKVISRTSTEKYASHPDNLKAIAQQLGVATILEGSVQKAGNQVLINVQLIDAHSDNHLWAESYTRTLDNIFGVEGEVAQKVADALTGKVPLSDEALLIAAYRATQFNGNTRRRATYDELISTGEIDLIHDAALRDLAMRDYTDPVIDQITQDGQHSEYRKEFRMAIPHDVQLALSDKCGDRVVPVGNYEGIARVLDYPCATELSPAAIYRGMRDAMNHHAKRQD